MRRKRRHPTSSSVATPACGRSSIASTISWTLDPQFALLRSLHPERLEGSRDKLYMFLSGWLGGPALYVERHGHPRLRARHLPFPIATTERDQWLACMRQAMDDTGVPDELRAALMKAFYGTADWMRNRAD